ncbi:general negative regulator of transcription subunit 3 [Diutina rugosa]
MANRKLQKDIDIIFKKISEGLHEFHYHYDRYEAINNDEDSDNSREKEKLESDLKKEIKRLQKFREQIKIWQSKDDIKALTLASGQLSQKLNENKRLIEEGMEMYKEVERTSKLKTFSNQSILMAASMDNDDDVGLDDADGSSDGWDTDQDVDEFLSDPEEEEYSEETVQEILFFQDIIHQLSAQLQKLHGEYDKLVNKKVRKNNSGTIEAKKEKIQATLAQHKIHIKKILKLIRLLKLGKLSDMNLLEVVKSDLERYVDTNGEFDNNLYEDIFNAVNAEDVDYTAFDDTEVDADDSSVLPSTEHVLPSASTSRVSSVNHGQTTSLPSASSSNHLPLAQNSPPNSPAIVKALRPASTPLKPVGNLKWSAAAAVGLPEPLQTSSSRQATPEVDQGTNGHHETNGSHETSPSTPVNPVSSSEKTILRTPVNDTSDPNFKYLEVIQNSNLSPAERNMFSDLNLVRLPPGIQDLIISFTAKRNGGEDCAILRQSTAYGNHLYNPYVVPMVKPYLPLEVQPHFDNRPREFKLPPQFIKLQAYWNKVRALNQFDQFVSEIEALAASGSANETVVIELTSVLFYGHFYATTPMENIIAERALFRLGWKPYRTNGTGAITGKSGMAKDCAYFWFRRVKLISEDESMEFGDYQGFDVSMWEYFFKQNFKLDYELVQMHPVTALC